MLQWQHTIAINYLQKITNVLGEPNGIGIWKGGIAQWLKHNDKGERIKKGQEAYGENSIFSYLYGCENAFIEHSLQDENAKHYESQLRGNFFYSAVKICIPYSIITSTLDYLYGYVWYDAAKQYLWTRCYSLDANIIILSIATDIIRQHIDKDDNYITSDKFDALIFTPHTNNTESLIILPHRVQFSNKITCIQALQILMNSEPKILKVITKAYYQNLLNNVCYLEKTRDKC